ncbi:MAG: class I SAM-dependent methyltransferase [Proteobacteria bacterium]|nr:class I SAM-dependent methyltransferase [Pseudomonadota bacterium]
MTFKSIAIIAALVVSGCNAPEPAETTKTAEEPTQATAALTENIYRSAVNSAQRTPADVARDAGRKPAEVMEFFAIEPGMHVLDMFSGGGYYTEILSNVVGPDGKITAQSNKAYLSFSGEESSARYLDNRLPNTSILMAENNELALEADTYDAVTMILAYHDIYYDGADDGWPLIDGPKLLAELYKGMKSGAVLGIVDHNAAPDSPAETGNTTHRIDVNLVIREVEAAGFILDGRSDILRNDDDDYAKNVFAPETRGKTDRFVLRFRKPI